MPNVDLTMKNFQCQSVHTFWRGVWNSDLLRSGQTSPPPLLPVSLYTSSPYRVELSFMSHTFILQACWVETYLLAARTPFAAKTPLAAITPLPRRYGRLPGRPDRGQLQGLRLQHIGCSWGRPLHSWVARWLVLRDTAQGAAEAVGGGVFGAQLVDRVVVGREGGRYGFHHSCIDKLLKGHPQPMPPFTAPSHYNRPSNHEWGEGRCFGNSFTNKHLSPPPPPHTHTFLAHTHAITSREQQTFHADRNSGDFRGLHLSYGNGLSNYNYP